MNSSSPGPVVGLIYLVIAILWIAGKWKVYQKAGQPGWAAIVPIYSTIVFLEIIKKPMWWILLFFIPIVGWIVNIVAEIELAKKFNKGSGYGVGLALLPFIFYPMLGFGDTQFVGSGPVGVEGVLDSGM